MGVPCQSACSPWCDVAEIKKGAKCAAPPEGIADADWDAALTDWLAVATDSCFELSGRRWAGNCRTTVRPGRDWGEGCGGRPGGWPPFWLGGGTAVGDAAPWSWAFGCGCGLGAISLGVGPVTGIVEVKLDGDVLDAARYRVDDFRNLVRLPDADGTRRTWPCRQRMDLADDEPDTFSVSFTYGAPPPPGGVKAAAALACQLARAEAGQPCDLEPRAITKARQGVTIALQDPGGLIDRKKPTGIAALDWFLRTYAPTGGRPPAAIMSPDVPATRWAGT